MIKKSFNYMKNNPFTILWGVLATAAFLFFTAFLSFFILQADDFYYASFFKNGFFEFIRLTVDHFKTFNGRAFVHFCAQFMLALPPMLGALINSGIILALSYLSCRFSGYAKTKNDIFIWTILFYSFFMLLGNGIHKEAIMWVSAYYNYVFPALFTLLALLLFKKSHWSLYPVCFLAGATTEQWGAIAFVMIFTFTMYIIPKKVRIYHFMPCISVLLGYGTIFLSPATKGRLTDTGHATISGSLIDLPRLANIFMSEGSPIIIFILFTLVSMLMALIYKKQFSLLWSGSLPLALFVTLPLHNSHLSTTIIFVCYLVLCAAIFFYSRLIQQAIFISGAFVGTLIMIPTNTFESRVTFPSIFLLILTTLSILFRIKENVSKKAFCTSVIAFSVIAVIAFYPTFMGFGYNSTIERENRIAVYEAQKSGTLVYNIDYDKKYAMRQMFNDGWFYNQFMSLNSIENCEFVIKSKNLVELEGYKTKAILYNGEAYVPARAFLDEVGGTLTVDNGAVMKYNGETLTSRDGMLKYVDHDRDDYYVDSDTNTLPDFYTLYIRLYTLNDAFNINVKALC